MGLLLEGVKDLTEHLGRLAAREADPVDHHTRKRTNRVNMGSSTRLQGIVW